MSCILLARRQLSRGFQTKQPCGHVSFLLQIFSEPWICELPFVLFYMPGCFHRSTESSMWAQLLQKSELYFFLPFSFVFQPENVILALK